MHRILRRRPCKASLTCATYNSQEMAQNIHQHLRVKRRLDLNVEVFRGANDLRPISYVGVKVVNV
jgi:hypothetical protein